MDRPVPVREAAKLTGLEVRTVYRYIEKGAVATYVTPTGRLRVIPRDCLPTLRAQPSKK
jgi:excisionase family DNA binding protein